MATIYLIGDSTVDDNTPPFRGWGWALPEFVKEGVAVKNHALSGRSSKSFFEEGLFAPVEEAMGEGDLLLIQFGHNDEKDDAERHTDPESTFPEMLLYYIQAARRKGGQPVLITPVSRRFFAGATSLLYTHGEYPLAIRNLAKRESVPLCDLEMDSRKLYLDLGEEGAAKLFVQLAPGEHPDYPQGHDDRTHFCAEGAKAIAGLVAEELRQNPLTKGYMK
ncbi:MAG: rhamnogalacturonan acetylesterase [Clostridia bacterium]|nr:rhamnogalacturonan acetylesterase [Clostridia bacterium]